MKNVIVLCIVITIMSISTGFSQSSTSPPYGIKFSGFLKTDFFYDTRQSSEAKGIREGHFFLFPDNELFDNEGKDINANGSFHILSIQSRLKGSITGPDAFGARTSGLIEAEFFGTSGTDLNGMRLRHAFVNLQWTKSSLMIGQNWHPMFPAQSVPGTISFNTGSPFIPFSRNPQIRYTFGSGGLKMQFSSYAQRDFTSPGPVGYSNKYLRNSTLPGANFQFQYTPSESKHFFMIGADYKTLKPEIVTSQNYATDETISSFCLFSSLRFFSEPFTIKAMGTYGQNTADLMMLGGYAVRDTIDLTKGYKKYTNLSVVSTWVDIHSNGEKLQYGLFAGYSKNMGPDKDAKGEIFARGADVSNLWRISPRLSITSGKLTFGNEIEITQAAYKSLENNVEVLNPVINVRFLFAAVYNF